MYNIKRTTEGKFKIAPLNSEKLCLCMMLCNYTWLCGHMWKSAKLIMAMWIRVNIQICLFDLKLGGVNWHTNKTCWAKWIFSIDCSIILKNLHVKFMFSGQNMLVKIYLGRIVWHYSKSWPGNYSLKSLKDNIYCLCIIARSFKLYSSLIWFCDVVWIDWQ